MRYTYVRQHDTTDCAAACLAMVCLHYKKEIKAGLYLMLLQKREENACLVHRKPSESNRRNYFLIHFSILGIAYLHFYRI